MGWRRRSDDVSVAGGGRAGAVPLPRRGGMGRSGAPSRVWPGRRPASGLPSVPRGPSSLSVGQTLPPSGSSGGKSTAWIATFFPEMYTDPPLPEAVITMPRSVAPSPRRRCGSSRRRRKGSCSTYGRREMMSRRASTPRSGMKWQPSWENALSRWRSWIAYSQTMVTPCAVTPPSGNCSAHLSRI